MTLHARGNVYLYTLIFIIVRTVVNTAREEQTTDQIFYPKLMMR